MKKEDLKKIEKYFTLYSEGEYVDCYSNESGEKMKKYYHKEYDEFKLIVFEKGGDVYQLNSDHEIQGIELVGFESLRVRFSSFEGEDISDIPDDRNNALQDFAVEYIMKRIRKELEEAVDGKKNFVTGEKMESPVCWENDLGKFEFDGKSMLFSPVKSLESIVVDLTIKK